MVSCLQKTAGVERKRRSRARRDYRPYSQTNPHGGLDTSVWKISEMVATPLDAQTTTPNLSSATSFNDPSPISNVRNWPDDGFRIVPAQRCSRDSLHMYI